MYAPNTDPQRAPTKPSPPPLDLPDRVNAAKWPPDDLPSSPKGPPGQFSGGGAGGDDGNFKRGAVKPVAIGLAVLTVVGAVALAALAVRSEGAKLSKEDIAREKRGLAVLPMAEQLPKWRAWAARDDVPSLQQEAYAQLGWAKDKEAIPLIVKGLASTDHRVRGTAATALLEYGPIAADASKPALLKAFTESDSGDKPQIAWALAVFKETSAFDEVMKVYRAGNLAKVQRLDESPAFDPDVFAAMVPLDTLSKLVADESESARQLVATALSRTGDPKWTDQLIKLVSDKSVDVAREAAVGLGKIANEKSMGPLVDALSRADKDSRAKFLEALRDGVGGKGLVLALKSVQRDTPNRQKFQTKQIFDMLRELEDPRVGDSLAEYLATNPPPHWRTEAALRMAEIGDLRAVPHIAWRMKQDPLKLYDQQLDPDYRMDDNERVVGARMLADLAMLYPDKKAELLAQAEEGVLFWITDKPQPYANGMRFLVAAGSEKALEKIRNWADPRDALPREGQQEFVPSWSTAQSALRYLGWAKDPQAWGLLDRQLNRRPDKVDATMESLLQGGLAVLGMTLKALSHGAADGFAQWGDSKAYATLVKHIEDPMNNEQGRLQACFALGWVSTDDQMKEIVKKVKDFNKPDVKSAFIRGCYLEALVRRPVPEASAGLIDLFRPDVELEVRHQAARAIGFGGVRQSLIPQLFDKLKDVNLRADAALALLIGADADTARRAIASYNDGKPEEMEELKVIYNQTFGYWSDRNYENGDVARWIANAEAVAHVRVHDSFVDWPRMILGRAVQGIEFDNGPHSITRVRFRVRLLRDAKSTNELKRHEAIEILKFMRERGVLLALRGEPEPVGSEARQAYFEVMNPKSVTQVIPDAPKAGGSGAPAGGAKVLPP